MVKQTIIRMNYNSLVRIQKVFPAYAGETMPNYFGRLAKELERRNEANGNKKNKFDN